MTPGRRRKPDGRAKEDHRLPQGGDRRAAGPPTLGVARVRLRTRTRCLTAGPPGGINPLHAGARTPAGEVNVMSTELSTARPGSQSNPWAALLVLCLGFFVILLDATIVNVAIPTMLDSLHARLDQILWVVNAFLLTLAVLLITGGRLGDIFGQRNLFIVGLGAFVAA